MKAKILELVTDVTNHEKSTGFVIKHAKAKAGKYVCVSNVHMCMEVYNNPDYAEIVNKADLVVPDGKPLVWAQKLLGYKDAAHVRGTDLTLNLCRQAELKQIPIGLYGGSQDAVEKFLSFLETEYPSLKIACSFSPPFRQLTEDEDNLYTRKINESGARILFVGLGCPKQEMWMAKHKNRLDCVMLGVGAAFDFLSGEKEEAPRWMQNMGLEWGFRLSSEPDRLWKRYARHNPRFIALFLRQLMRDKFGKNPTDKSSCPNQK